MQTTQRGRSDHKPYLVGRRHRSKEDLKKKAKNKKTKSWRHKADWEHCYYPFDNTDLYFEKETNSTLIRFSMLIQL